MNKPLLIVSLTVVLSLATASLYQTKAVAGDREWATAGKILTGVIGARVLYDVFDDRDYCRSERRVYIEQPRYYRHYGGHDVVIIERYHRPVYPRYRRRCYRY